MYEPITLTSRRQGKSLALLHLIGFCIKQNRSIVIGISSKERLARLNQLRVIFPEATFRFHDLGIELCRKK